MKVSMIFLNLQFVLFRTVVKVQCNTEIIQASINHLKLIKKIQAFKKSNKAIST